MAKLGLKELINTGVLPVGTELYHATRRHRERAVSATVRATGIEVNGKIYPSPSAAARAVSGTDAENGWIWWRIKTTGQQISGLRYKG